jgi:hypothetical protein
MKLKGLYFDWKLDSPYWKGEPRKGREIGFIAQEVREIVPEVIIEREDGMLTLQYDKLVTIAIGSIQEQNLRVKDIQKRINNFKEIISNG